MSKYTLDVSKEEIIEIYVKEWVLEWCRKYHPKVFEEAHKHLNDLYNEKNNSNTTN